MSILPAHRPTILDVARECGLSKATVSKALNAPKGSPLVSDETRQRVKEIAESLGYRPSWRGQVLANRRSQTIAIAYSSIIGAVPRTVYWEIVDRLEQQLAGLNYLQTFLHVREEDDRVDRMLGDGRFDGCICLGMIAQPMLEMLRRNRVPTVLINSGPTDESWSRVDADDLQGGMDAMRHLLDCGHRSILYYAGERQLDHPSALHRYEAYRRCMESAGRSPLPPLVGQHADVITHLKNSPDRPTAVVDFEHSSAVKLLQCLWQAGFHVPGDVSVVTFNNTYPVEDVHPALTTVALPGQAMADVAVDYLMRLIDNPDSPPQQLLLGESLVVRGSVSRKNSSSNS